MPENKELDVSAKTKQSLMWFTMLPFVIHFVRFASSIWLARILMPSDFGIIGIITVLFYYCDLVTEFGLSNAIIQRKDVTEQHYNSYFVFNILISGLFYLIFLVIAKPIAIFFEEPDIELALQVFSSMFLISAFIAAPQAQLKRELKFKVLSQIEAVSVMVSIIISLYLAYNGYGYWSMIWAMLAAQFVVLVLTYAASSVKLRLYFSWRCLRQLMSFGIWDFLWGQTILLGENIDKLILAKYLGTTQLGFYDKALGFAQMPNTQVAKRLSMVSFSSFSRIREDKVAVDNYFSKMMSLNSFLCFPIFIGLASVANNFTLVLLGEKWAPMIESLAVLSLAFLVASIANPVISMNMAGGKIKQQTIIRFICVVALIATLLNVVSHGILVASFAILGFYVLQFMMSYFLLYKAFDIGWLRIIDYLFAPTFCSGLMLLAVYFINNNLFVEIPSLNLLTAIIGGGLVYTVCFICIPFKSLAFLRGKVLRKLSF